MLTLLVQIRRLRIANNTYAISIQLKLNVSNCITYQGKIFELLKINEFSVVRSSVSVCLILTLLCYFALIVAHGSTLTVAFVCLVFIFLISVFVELLHKEFETLILKLEVGHQFAELLIIQNIRYTCTRYKLNQVTYQGIMCNLCLGPASFWFQPVKPFLCVSACDCQLMIFCYTNHVRTFYHLRRGY